MAEILREEEKIPLNGSTKGTNSEVTLVLRAKKQQERNKSKTSHAEEDRDNYIYDIPQALQQKKPDNLDVNQLISTKKNVSNVTAEARRTTEQETFVVHRIICPEEVVQNKNFTDTNILVITIQSEVTQVGSRNQIILKNEKDETLQTIRIQETEEPQTSHAGTDYLTTARKKKVPTENTDIEVTGEAQKPRENVDIFGDGRKHVEATTEGSDSSDLRMSKIRKHHRQKRRELDKRRAKQKNYKIRNDVEKKVHNNLAPASPSASYISLCKISDDVMFQLQVVRDNGRWKAFDNEAVTLSCKYQSKESQTVIFLEKAMAACYQGRLEESEKMILKAIDMSKDSENSSILIGRGFHYLSGVYRRMGLIGKAEDCLIKAEQNFHNQALTLDSTFLAYERASVLMDFISKCPNPTEKIMNDAKACLVKCITGCIALEGEANSQRYVKKHHFAFIKIAMLLLNCRTALGRKRTVSQQSIKEAEESLETLKTRYWEGIAQGEKVQYFLGLTDMYFRRKQYPKAEESAKQALDMAKKYGFKTEIKPAEDRLEEIRRQHQEDQEPCCIVEYMSETSVSQNTDVTSSESDFMKIPSFL